MFTGVKAYANLISCIIFKLTKIFKTEKQFQIKNSQKNCLSFINNTFIANLLYLSKIFLHSKPPWFNVGGQFYYFLNYFLCQHLLYQMFSKSKFCCLCRKFGVRGQGALVQQKTFSYPNQPETWVYVKKTSVFAISIILLHLSVIDFEQTSIFC